MFGCSTILINCCRRALQSSLNSYSIYSPIQDFGAMALLRQYSLLNLPPTWKASLISSYGSFLTQNQQDFSSPFHRASFLGRAAARGIGANSSGGSATASNLPPFPPNHPNQTLGLPPLSVNNVVKSPEASSPAVGSLPTPPPLSAAPSALSPPALHAPHTPATAMQRLGQTAASRKSATTSSPSRTSPSTANNKQRTYPCNECGKIFNAHYNLTRHMPVHTGNTFLTRIQKLNRVLGPYGLCWQSEIE